MQVGVFPHSLLKAVKAQIEAAETKIQKDPYSSTS